MRLIMTIDSIRRRRAEGYGTVKDRMLWSDESTRENDFDVCPPIPDLQPDNIDAGRPAASRDCTDMTSRHFPTFVEYRDLTAKDIVDYQANVGSFGQIVGESGRRIEGIWVVGKDPEISGQRRSMPFHTRRREVYGDAIDARCRRNKHLIAVNEQREHILAGEGTVRAPPGVAPIGGYEQPILRPREKLRRKSDDRVHKPVRQSRITFSPKLSRVCGTIHATAGTRACEQRVSDERKSFDVRP